MIHRKTPGVYLSRRGRDSQSFSGPAENVQCSKKERKKLEENQIRRQGSRAIYCALVT